MNIFSPDFPHTFELFTPSHIITMTTIAIIWIIIPVALKRRNSNQTDMIFRYTLAALLIVQYLGWMLWEFIVGRFSVALSLPLNLCDASNFLCAVLLINKKYKLYEVLYFWALAGTIQSFITPNIYYAFPHFEFFVFYIQHGGEILTILYLTVVTGFRPKALSMVKAFVYLLLFVGAVYLFNLLSGSNYMFLMADTPHESTVSKMIKIFGEPPRHMIGLGLVSVISIIVLYLPFTVKDLISKSHSLTK